MNATSTPTLGNEEGAPVESHVIVTNPTRGVADSTTLWVVGIIAVTIVLVVLFATRKDGRSNGE